MRQNNSSRRSRGRGRGGNANSKPNRMQVFDSNGPEVKIRGTAHQIADKYESLAKDATSSDDPTLAQNYLQHAEHYRRMNNSFVEHEERQKAEKEEELALPETMVPPANSETTEDKELETA